MNLPPGFLDELRGRISLARLVGRKVSWDPRKSNAGRGDYWAPCPFHQEKTASFHVDDGKGFYYCFGCHAKGDAISFLREVENLGFMEAVEALAEEAGLPMPSRRPESRAADDRRSRLHAAMEAAVGFYRLQLATARAAEARAHLDGRGLTPAMRERFEIGWAPDGRDILARHLADKGFRPEELAEAGLIAIPDDGRPPYDRFRGRIVFPIRDTRGRAIALGGRSLDPKARAKYLNSPETPLFDKSRTLFNLRDARAAVGRSGPLLVVEGYMDVIALVQAGFEAAVAPLGTAITEEQLEQIWRVCPEPLVALDGDRAGLAAAHRLVDLALPRLVAGRSLRFVLLPPGQDPDDLLRAGGRAAMERLIADSQPVVELLWRRESEGQSLDSPERRAALEARLKAHLDRFTDDRLRAHTAIAFRERLDRFFATARRPQSSASRGRRNAFPGRGRAPAPIAASAAAKASLLARAPDGAAAEARIRESAILFGLLNHPELVPTFEDQLDRMSFLCPDLAEIRDALLFCSAGLLTESTGASPPAAAEGAALPPSRTEFTDRIARRIGRDPISDLAGLGQLRANPHLRAGADPARAAVAIEEEMVRHAAWMDKKIELREAMETIAHDRDADEGLTWRLREVAEAQHRASRASFADDMPEAASTADLSRQLQELIDRQVWKRPRGAH